MFALLTTYHTHTYVWDCIIKHRDELFLSLVSLLTADVSSPTHATVLDSPVEFAVKLVVLVMVEISVEVGVPL